MEKNIKEKTKKYNKLISEVESMPGYDGRGKGVDVYVCEKCGHRFYTRYKDKGVTPFAIRCRNCDHGTAVHKDTISEQIASFMNFNVHNWIRPTLKHFLKLPDYDQDHILRGGLILEEETITESSEKELTEEQMSELAKCFSSHGVYGIEGNTILIDGGINPEQILKAADFIRNIIGK